MDHQRATVRVRYIVRSRHVNNVFSCLGLSPSQSYTSDTIRGMTLTDIGQTCDDVAESVAWMCTRLNPKGSLLRVQHLAFAGLKS